MALTPPLSPPLMILFTTKAPSLGSKSTPTRTQRRRIKRMMGNMVMAGIMARGRTHSSRISNSRMRRTTPTCDVEG